MTRKASLFALMAIAAAFWLASSCLYVVSEGQQVLIFRLGDPVGVVAEPGLRLKMPWIDSVVTLDTRLLPLDPPIEQVILGDQKRIEVDTYTRFRIADPLRFYQALRTLELGRAQLTQLVGSSVRRELGKVNLKTLLSSGRERVVDNIKAEIGDRARAFGIEIIDIRLHRADLPSETSQAIYDRMKSERQREARELRAQGAEWAQQITSRADADRTILLADAQRRARIARGDGDATASRLLADAFSRDKPFFIFYRAMQSYRQTLASSATTLVLSPDSKFLRFFNSGPDAPGQN